MDRYDVKWWIAITGEVLQYQTPVIFKSSHRDIIFPMIFYGI